jgi:signal transduction histidine kinase
MATLLAVLWVGLVGAFTAKVARDGGGFSATEGAWPGIALLLEAGWALGLASAVVASRQRHRSMAALLTVSSTAWFVSEWANPAAPALVFTVGLCLGAATPAALFAAALVAVDWGQVRLARLVSWSGLVVMVGLVGLAGATVFDPRASGCPDCPANLVGAGHDPSTWLDVSRLGLRAAIAWLGAALVVLAMWFVRSGPRGRRDGAWQVLAAAAFLALELIETVRSLDTGFLASDADAHALWRYQAVVLVTFAIACVADVLRARRAERDLTRVVRGLASGDDLVAGLSARLADPSLVAAYPVADGTSLLDRRGEPAPSLVGPGRLATSVGPADAPIAVLGHRADLAPSRVRDLAAAVHLALDHQRLQAQAFAQLAELRRSGLRILTTGDAERRRLERDLHDGAQQSLVTLLLGVRLARAQDPDDPALRQAEEHLESAVEGLRTLAHGLYPVLLERAGLAAAVRAMAETRLLRLQRLPDTRFDPVIESTVYLLIEQATSHAASADAAVFVEDGWIRAELDIHGSCPYLTAVSDRITALNGTLSVTSGDSCAVVASLPVVVES